MDHYDFIIQGHIGDSWTKEIFSHLHITRLADGDSLLSGDIRDQAELHGILNHIRDLGLVLKKVTKD